MCRYYLQKATRLVRTGQARDSDVDVHLELYQNELDTRFQYQALFLGLSSQRSISGSNTYRIDRLNTSSVKGRRSGEALDSTPVRNDKMIIVVDTVLYIRNPIDYQDDWTGPDFLTEMGQNTSYDVDVACTGCSYLFAKASVFPAPELSRWRIKPRWLQRPSRSEEERRASGSVYRVPDRCWYAPARLCLHRYLRRCAVPYGDFQQVQDPGDCRSKAVHLPYLGRRARVQQRAGLLRDVQHRPASSGHRCSDQVHLHHQVFQIGGSKAEIATFGLETLQANAAYRKAAKAATDVPKNIQLASVESGRKATKKTRKAADVPADTAEEYYAPLVPSGARGAFLSLS
ncbi:major capsid protein [Klebsiella virus 2019KP1]|nr:major capsid protein [Klebsiella virus 2019KP1]